jgi:low temperature requirement protein LtrA
MKRLLQPPRLRSGETSENERHATWMELFYDLVFVVALAELSHSLSQHVSLTGIAAFAALFVPVWWCWIGTTFYSDRFDTDDAGNRMLTALQMLAVAALAINVHFVLEKGSPREFALAYIAMRVILVFMYFRAGLHIPVARPLAYRYALGFSLAIGCWISSIFVSPPVRVMGRRACH